jgi:hypothetical protein
VLLEHVALEVDGGREEASAQVAGEGRTAGESVFDQMGLEFEGRVELAGAEAARVQASLRHQMAGHVRLDLGLAGENLLTLDALVAPGGGYRLRQSREEGRLLLVNQHLIVDVETVFADVSLLAVEGHPVGDEIGRLEMALAEGARIERRLGLGRAGRTDV